MIEKAKQSLKTLWEKGLVHIFAGSFLTKCISFFGSIVLVKALSKFEYGVLGYLENIYGYVWIFAGLGLSNAILRFCVLGESRDQKRAFFSYAVKTAFLCNIALVLIGSLFNTVYPHRTDYAPYAWLLFILLPSLPFQYLTDNVLGHERAMFDNRRYVLFSMILSISVIAGKVLFGHWFGIRGAVFSQAGTYLVLGLVFLASTCKKHYGSLRLSAGEGIVNRKEVNSYSVQYMITNGLWAIFMLNDVYLLGRFAPAEVLAEYKVAYTIPGCVTLISTSIGIFVAPYFVKNENDRAWVRDNYKKAFLATAALVGAVCAAITVLAKYLVLWLYGEQYLPAVPVMRLLLIASFCNCGLRYTTANILAAMGQVKYNMAVSAVGTVLQILINLWMIPRYSSYGVAITSCIVYSFMAVSLFIVFYQKYYRSRA